MFHKLFITLILCLFAWPGTSQANLTALVNLHLSLAGYQLGMSQAEAAQVRPFHLEQSPATGPATPPTFYAVAEHVYIDGVAMNLMVSFRDDKAYKIVARVSPDFFKNVKEHIELEVGAGEYKSKVFRNYNNEEIRQTIYLWTFPNAKLYLVGVSSNPEFVTISLTGK